MARATSSLPVPVSPVMRTVESLGATLEMRESTACKAGEVPTSSSNIDALLISSRRATFSCCSLSSACLRSSISVEATYQRTTFPCHRAPGWNEPETSGNFHRTYATATQARVKTLQGLNGQNSLGRGVGHLDERTHRGEPPPPPLQDGGPGKQGRWG